MSYHITISEKQSKKVVYDKSLYDGIRDDAMNYIWRQAAIHKTKSQEPLIGVIYESSSNEMEIVDMEKINDYKAIASIKRNNKVVFNCGFIAESMKEAVTYIRTQLITQGLAEVVTASIFDVSHYEMEVVDIDLTWRQHVKND